MAVQLVTLAQSLPYLQVLRLLYLVSFQFVYQVAQAVDVVGESQAAHCLDESETQGLLVIDGCEIAEADREHDCGAPVVGPGVLFDPWAVLYVAGLHPVVVLVDPAHEDEDDGDAVGDTEVSEEYFDQLPVLF